MVNLYNRFARFVAYSLLAYGSIYYQIFTIVMMKKRIPITQRNKNNISFFVCCDGNGHFTQFMELANIIKKRSDKKVVSVYLNCNEYVKIPQYVTRFCHDNEISIEYFYGISLNQFFNDGKVEYGNAFLTSVWNIPKILTYTNNVVKTLNKSQCGTMINLFSGDYALMSYASNLGCDTLFMATQLKYMIEGACRPEVNTFMDWIGASAIYLLSNMMSIPPKTKSVCISPLPLPSQATSSLHSDSAPPLPSTISSLLGNIDVIPAVTKFKSTDRMCEKDRKGKLICVYSLYELYVGHIIDVSTHFKDVDFVVFTPTSSMYTTENVTVHPLDKERFRFTMCRANIYIGTAGVESVCEAITLKLPIITIPVDDHYEQYTNAFMFSKNMSQIHTVSSFSNVSGIVEKIDHILNSNLQQYEQECERVIRYYETLESRVNFLLP